MSETPIWEDLASSHEGEAVAARLGGEHRRETWLWVLAVDAWASALETAVQDQDVGRLRERHARAVTAVAEAATRWADHIARTQRPVDRGPFGALLCRLRIHRWEPRESRRGAKYLKCARCEAERMGGLVVDLERRRGA